MRRFIMQLTVVALGLSLTGAVQAGGKGGSGGGGSKSFSQSSKSFNGSNSSKNFSYSKYGKSFSKSDFCWSHSCYCSRYGCNCYWNDGCWYTWYQPTCQYIPYTYYVTLVTPVVTVTPVQTAGNETGPIGAVPDDSGTLPIAIPVSLDSGPAAGQGAPAVSSGHSTAARRPVHHAVGSWNSRHQPRFPSRARRAERVPAILGSISDPSRAERVSHQNRGEATLASGHRGSAARR